MKKAIGFIIFAAMLLAACSKSSDTPTTTGGGNCTTVSKFSTDASPVFQSQCATNSSCHATGAGNNGGVLATHAQISAKAASIKSQVNSGAMPRGSTLTTAQKTAIICWIDAGAMNN